MFVDYFMGFHTLKSQRNYGLNLRILGIIGFGERHWVTPFHLSLHLMHFRPYQHNLQKAMYRAW